jgi:NAD(P)-dependent dehydrogenase (short-subunit alcohol dehydrogenase family)
MQLEGKVAIVYGAAGSMGGAVARAFGAEGAQLFLAGRTLSKVRVIADETESAGGRAQAAEVDVDDGDAVERHADDVLAATGRIDVSFNAAGMDAIQDSVLVDMSLEDFMTPITEAARRHFFSATAAAPRTAPQGFGAIVMLTSSAAKEWRHHMGGLSVGCASIEVLTRGPGWRAQGHWCARGVHSSQLHAGDVCRPAGRSDRAPARRHTDPPSAPPRRGRRRRRLLGFRPRRRHHRGGTRSHRRSDRELSAKHWGPPAHTASIPSTTSMPRA